MRPIDEQTILITGATSGLGRELAQATANGYRSRLANNQFGRRRTQGDIEISQGKRPGLRQEGAATAGSAFP